MNGASLAASAVPTHDPASFANGDNAHPLDQLKHALQIVYNPYSSSNDRQRAGQYLEAAKEEKEAPYHGFKLATDRGLETVVRHFGLLLLDEAIRYHWQDYSPDESTAMRNWILALSENVSSEDPSYLRNKVAQLWVEVAKRSWGNEWLDMDEQLVKLWENASCNGIAAQRDLVLFVLETLVEDVFNREDSVAGLRNTILTKACIEIFTPIGVFERFYPQREPTAIVKFGDEGWLIRLVQMLDHALGAGIAGNAEAENCAVRILTTLKASMGWSITKAVAQANIVNVVGKALMVESTAIQMVATEVLYTLFSKPFFDDDDFGSLVCPMYHTDTLELLANIFNWIRIDPESIDDERYLFLKRFSEMTAVLGTFLEERAKSLPPEVDLNQFLELAFLIAGHDSFAISIPLLNLWTKLLRSNVLGQSSTVANFHQRLLELAGSRLLRYEVMEDSQGGAPLQFLTEDLDTLPERHAFLGNYRRFCNGIVENIVKRRPFEAFTFIMGNVDSTLGTLYNNGPAFSLDNYQKNSESYLRVDAQFTVIEAALRGYVKWMDANRAGLDVQVNDKAELEHNLEEWCKHILERKFEDPMISRRVIQLMVTFSTTALENRPSLMLKILEHILFTRPTEYPDNVAYSEAIKELLSVCTTEIQKLAVKMPDDLLPVYNELENKINELVTQDNIDDRTRIAFHTFLFTINHRSKVVDPLVRKQRLEGYIHPLRDAWSDPAMTEALQSFEGFCRLMELHRVQEYLITRRVHEIPDFSQYALDAEGQSLQVALNDRFKTLPIRATKAFISCSTDKLRKSSEAYEIACAIWHDTIPAILPNILQFLTHAHAFHNPQNWQSLPLESQALVKKILTDRFWQAGISTGTRDEFYSNVAKTKSTMEGLASAIRGSIRMVRESCYSILWCMSRLGVDFYGLNELPGPLAHALFADAHVLSSHQMSILLNMTRYIVDDCPTVYRQHFLSPLLASLFAQVDAKVSGEWNDLIEKGQITLSEDKLAEEMKEESILRQLTYTAVLIVAGLLDPQRPGEPISHAQISEGDFKGASETGQTMREFILSSDAILEPLILFCTHALRMRDSRCCGIIIRVFRSIVPEFQGDRPGIREYICREVLMASINSLHDDYFVDVQKDLAQLIAAICNLYSEASETPRQLLLSLPGITPQKVDSCFKRLGSAHSTRHQRALVLELLDGLRGTAMSEKGKVPRSQKQATQGERERRQHQERQQARYDQARQPTPELGEVAQWF